MASRKRETALNSLYAKLYDYDKLQSVTDVTQSFTYTGNYNITGLTVGDYYLIFQIVIDNNTRGGIVSGANIITRSNTLTTGKWKETYAHGTVMLVQATSSTITVVNSGSQYSTLSKAIVMHVATNKEQ